MERQNEIEYVLSLSMLELCKLAIFIRDSRDYIDRIYEKIEVDDPSKKEALFAPLVQLHSSAIESVDQLKQNIDNISNLNQGLKVELN